jgi:hypothetical protein
LPLTPDPAEVVGRRLARAGNVDDRLSPPEKLELLAAVALDFGATHVLPPAPTDDSDDVFTRTRVTRQSVPLPFNAVPENDDRFSAIEETAAVSRLNDSGEDDAELDEGRPNSDPDEERRLAVADIIDTEVDDVSRSELFRDMAMNDGNL